MAITSFLLLLFILFNPQKTDRKETLILNSARRKKSAVDPRQAGKKREQEKSNYQLYDDRMYGR